MMVGKAYVYSDGGCRPNPGRGGFGVVQRYYDENGEVHERELCEGFVKSTNNRMELRGAITALETLGCPCDVVLTTDSEYVVKGFAEGRVEKWKSNGWKNASKKPVPNRDLWERLLAAKERHVNVEFVHIDAQHDSGDTSEEAMLNARCDELVWEARAKLDSELLIDEGYETT